MKAKVIHTKVSKEGVIHVVDQDLPTGEVDLIVLINEFPQAHRVSDVKRIPLGGYKAGWLASDQLGREAIYEDY